MANISECTVTSEIYSEHEYISSLSKPKTNKTNVVSKFPFIHPPGKPGIDSDGDIIVQRKSNKDERKDYLEIEHSCNTGLALVGLQVWRGAFLLADWVLYNSEILENENGTILELGSGTGLSSIVAAFYTSVICTDINSGGILKLIQENVVRNKDKLKHSVRVLELDFLSLNFSKELQESLRDIKIILAADVVYDDLITEAFINTINKLLKDPPTKYVYIALEKRFVFTIADCDTVAPCYEHFLRCLTKLGKHIIAEETKIDFPQYFEYDRVKELVLWKLTSQF